MNHNNNANTSISRGYQSINGETSSQQNRDQHMQSLQALHSSLGLTTAEEAAATDSSGDFLFGNGDLNYASNKDLAFLAQDLLNEATQSAEYDFSLNANNGNEYFNANLNDFQPAFLASNLTANVKNAYNGNSTANGNVNANLKENALFGNVDKAVDDEENEEDDEEEDEVDDADEEPELASIADTQKSNVPTTGENTSKTASDVSLKRKRTSAKGAKEKKQGTEAKAKKKNKTQYQRRNIK